MMTMRNLTAVVATSWALLGCGHSGYAVRPIPAIATDSVGKPVSVLREAFGAPRRIDVTPTKQVYNWFLEEKPAGAPAGFHGCELEVTVDIRSEDVLGYALANVGWGRCAEVRRKIRLVDRASL